MAFRCGYCEQIKDALTQLKNTPDAISVDTEFGKITDLDRFRSKAREKLSYHKTKDGEVIHISDMTDTHLNNLIRYYENSRTVMVEYPSDGTIAMIELESHGPIPCKLKDRSIGHSIKYDLLLEEKAKRAKESEVE